MRLFLSLVLILVLSGTGAHPSPETGPEPKPTPRFTQNHTGQDYNQTRTKLGLTGTLRDPEKGPETGPETRPETEPETGPEPGSEECRRLRAPLSLEDKTPVLGRFHFLLGHTDNVLYRTLMNLTSSFWFNITETKTGLELNQFSRMNGTCVKTSANATITGTIGQALMYNVTTHFGFVKLSESLMVLDFFAHAPDIRDFAQKYQVHHFKSRPTLRARSLYLLSRRPDVSDRDLQLFRDHARCEGFRGDLHYRHQNHEFCSESESVPLSF